VYFFSTIYSSSGSQLLVSNTLSVPLRLCLPGEELVRRQLGAVCEVGAALRCAPPCIVASVGVRAQVPSCSPGLYLSGGMCLLCPAGADCQGSSVVRSTAGSWLYQVGAWLGEGAT
jgi:hypothetical protein